MDLESRYMRQRNNIKKEGLLRTDQIPFSRKFFKNSGVVPLSDRDSFSYLSSSFNFWESEMSAANERDVGTKHEKNKKRTTVTH